jgi:hypothetical protein
MDLDVIERLLRERRLVSSRDVEQWLAELEAAAEAGLRAPAGSLRRADAAIRLNMIAEYEALRAFALRQGWSLPDGDWPLPSVRAVSASRLEHAPPNGDSDDPAEALLEQAHLAAGDASDQPDVERETIVLREQSQE